MQRPIKGHIDLTLTDLGGTHGEKTTVSAIAYTKAAKRDARRTMSTLSSPVNNILATQSYIWRAKRPPPQIRYPIRRLSGYETAGGDVADLDRVRSLPEHLAWGLLRGRLHESLVDPELGRHADRRQCHVSPLTANLPAGFIRPMSVEFISNNGVNALLVGGVKIRPAHLHLGSQRLRHQPAAKSPITVADSDGKRQSLRAGGHSGRACRTPWITQLCLQAAVDVLAVGASAAVCAPSMT